MNSATKNILTASLRVYEADKDKEANVLWVEEQVQSLEKSKWLNARNSSDANHYQAYKIFLRMKKPKTKMSKTDKKEVNHSERAHALLSASGASRWLNCTPSPRLEEGFANESSSFAEEGTLAHEFAELNLKGAIGIIDIKAGEYKSLTEPLRKSLLYSEDMEEFVQVHIDYVLEQFAEAKRKTPDAILLIEQKVDITHLIENGFGTCDVIIIADGTLEVIDLKYGLGVRVSAEDNSQLKLYGSGALEAYDLMYDIHTVKLTITQPRMDSISSWEISAEDLRQWGEDVVKPKAQIAYAGEGEQVTGDHCFFDRNGGTFMCPLAPFCRAVVDKVEEFTKEVEANNPMLVGDAELIKLYEKVPFVSKWVKAVSDHVYSEAMNGKKWEGYKLVDGQNRRGWTDEGAVIEIMAAEYHRDQYLNEPKLKGIGDIEKLVGKKVFPELLGDVVAFKKTSPSIVPESDKRPALGIDQAKADFADDL